MPEDDFSEEPIKRGALGRVLTSLMVLIVLAIVVAGAGVFYAQTEMQQRGPLEKGKIVTIKRGMGSGAIARMLEKEGVISNAGIFMAATYVLRSSNGSLKAGEYQIPASSSMAEVLGILQAGKSLAYKVTIPEGWTTQNALARIAANKVLKGNITVKPGEGTLLPDTYVFQRGTTRDGLIARMQAAQKKLLDKLWSKRQKNLPIKTRAEAITLASIVERETGIGAERPKVAAVFVNRLKKKMRLQSDPTIIYGIVGGKGKMDRPLSKKDIAKKTRYNTYQIDGLPPTPIANPGREAIAAVLNPDNIDALYFVADGSGGHAFAKTLKGHENNVSNWRKIEHDRRKAAAAKTAASKSDKKATPAKKLLPATKQSAPVKHPAKPDLAKTPTGKSIPLPPVKPAQN